MNHLKEIGIAFVVILLAARFVADWLSLRRHRRAIRARIKQIKEPYKGGPQFHEIGER